VGGGSLHAFLFALGLHSRMTSRPTTPPVRRESDAIIFIFLVERKCLLEVRCFGCCIGQDRAGQEGRLPERRGAARPVAVGGKIRIFSMAGSLVGLRLFAPCVI